VANGDLRLSIPGAGRTVASSAEERAVFVREAVDIVAEALAGQEIEADFVAVYGARWELGETGAQHDPVTRRAAWAIINVWITAALAGGQKRGAGISEAEDWFYGTDKAILPSLAKRLDADTRFKLTKPLGKLRADSALLDLLP